MNAPLSRRKLLATFGGIAAGLAALPLARNIKQRFVKKLAPSNYVPTDHKWLMCVDVDKCIGCGLCADACKTENHVPEASHFFRTWIERYIIKKPKDGELTARGEVLVDSPNGGRGGFPPSAVPKEDILKAFYVPKLCNLCVDSPCTQVCPVGATFDAPDGAVLVDPTYCIGCGFCIQACPYGCRFMTPDTPETRAQGTAGTAQKCTLCYHRITRGLKPACVEICPTQARVFGDLKHPIENDPLLEFVKKNKVNTLKPHLGTNARLLYANLDKEVR